MTETTVPTTTDEKAWSYLAGEKGRNRVRVWERGSQVWIDYKDVDASRVRQTLAHSDRELAKQQADQIAAQLAGGQAPARRKATWTFEELVDIYRKEVTPYKGKTSRKHDERTLPLLLKSFGSQSDPSKFDRTKWDKFIRDRKKGVLAPKGREGKGVKTRVLEQDCTLLMALLNWATETRDPGTGHYYLERNPLKGMEIPREISPRRAVLTEEQFPILREAAAQIGIWFEVFVILMWYTGHRCQSVRQLRWSDIDFATNAIRWRAQNDKMENEHETEAHPKVLEALKGLKASTGRSGEDWVFPSARNASKPRSKDAMNNLWRRLADAAGIQRGRRFGWHSFRRAFANNLREVPLRDLKDLGGWKTAQTIVRIYQFPQREAQRSALSKLA